MDSLLPPMIVAVVVVCLIIVLTLWSSRLGTAPPLILMLVGVGISFLPFVASIEIDPEVILAVILPPLLYSAAISMPTVELRRDFAPVGGLAVILVVISAIALGFVIHWIVPSVPLHIGIALGAILSPTDAAATTVIKRLGVPGRVGTILQGESLLNDATSLVLMRSAVVATAASVSFWGIAGQFLFSAATATVIGGLVGLAGIWVRKRVKESAAGTAISFVIPFVAFIPCELIHASGLVAVVTAGLVAAQLGPRRLDARQRVSEQANWHTVEFLLEGAVFFAMGLELYGLVKDLYDDGETLSLAIGLAGLALLLVLLIRGGFLAILLRQTRARTQTKVSRGERWKKANETMKARQASIESGQFPQLTPEQAAQARAAIARRLESSHSAASAAAAWRIRQAQPGGDRGWEHLDPNAVEHRRRTLSKLGTHVRRYLADVEYLLRQPLGVREGVLLTWGGARGVVTLAAAQTLPVTVPHRSLLILIAFIVAAGSLILQGGTLPWVVKWLGLAGSNSVPEGERERLDEELAKHSQAVKIPEGTSPDQASLLKIRATRGALLDLRSTGLYSAETLSTALAELDADEIGLQLRLSEQH